MIQTEKMILEEIMRLLNDLENSTYGETKNNGLDFPPNLSKFYYGTKRLYKIVDELVERFNPEYITYTDYKYICESQKDTLLQLAVLKDNKKLKGIEVTWELENHLTKIQGLFSCISTYCSHQGENCGNVRVGGGEVKPNIT